MFFSFIGCKGETDIHHGEVSTLMGKISDNVEFRVLDDNSKIWLDNSHIEKISLKTNTEGNKTLVFTTTEAGKTLLQNAATENLGKIISVSANQYLFSSDKIVMTIDNGYLTLDSTKFIDYAYLYNYLTDEKDKMKGVTPPEDLISEDTAKNKVFERANTAADDVTQLSIELKIDEDFFGWIYCINFTADNKDYKTEVNAHSGGITKFNF